MPLTVLVYCVTVAFTMTERADQLHHNTAPAHSTALVQVFWQSITTLMSVSPPTAQIWLPATGTGTGTCPKTSVILLDAKFNANVLASFLYPADTEVDYS